ncbi:phosphotransferase enzyme family protein [Quadrisphaera setariae]|uniref:Phosphotransferase n=1 Tax=Quadrisphaera setariae TaxID=2593304 RepID=A0A5C8ZC80_9ACTN|nr:phosphotransferase [Quadrisphaera setariae]TXR55715.1 phosphotransferase [Quadrisphaera setariae]
MDEEELADVVLQRWGLPGAVVQPLGGGMNSRTWVVEVTAPCGQVGRWAAKQVAPALHPPFRRGLLAASLVEGAGVRAGVPRPTVGGADHADLPDGPLALLRWVDGTPLDDDDDDAPALMGAALGTAHRVLRGVDDGSAARFPPWPELEGDHLDVEPWVRPAVAGALATYRDLLAGSGGGALGGSSVGLLHADPAPDAFLRPVSGDDPRCGLIDWSSAEHGPLLYDVASAVMYVGGYERGRALVEAYAEVVAPEADAAALLPQVEVLLGLRQAVQAAYFARRLAVDDLTGIDGPEGNLEGLHHARDFFAALG